LFAYTYEFNNGSLKSSVPGTSCIIWIWNIRNLIEPLFFQLT
jgi:hypothetical protein